MSTQTTFDVRTITGCYCPSDCSCHSERELTVCGCTGLHGDKARKAIDLDAPIWQDCWKCGGTGFLAEYANIFQGVCFGCDGTRGKHTTQRKLDRNAKARERYAAKKEAERVERHAKAEADEAEARSLASRTREQFVAANPGIEQALEVLDGDFGKDLRERLDEFGALTERQTAAALRIAAEKATEPAPSPVVEGRIEIVGKVSTTKWVDNAYGGALKMLVLDDRGFKVWGTVPSALEVEQGYRVGFTATVTASTDDESFGWYKRPSKAEVLEG